MSGTRRVSLLFLPVCFAISLYWGFCLERASPNPMSDFKGVYNYARCLLQHRDPYRPGEPLRVYIAEEEGHSQPSDVLRNILMFNMYPPSAYVFTVPFAMLPWVAAELLWLTFTAAIFLLAAILMWNCGANSAPIFTACWLGFLLANCEAVFVTGNPAGIVVGLCVTAVWCFLTERFAIAGIFCLALSLAIKPHDSGLVWLFFLLAGGVYRKRALQTLAVAVALCLPMVAWVSYLSPHWIHELHDNLQMAAAPGGQLNLGAVTDITGRGPSMRIDLQSAISLFWSDPRIYLPVSYAACGSLLVIWAFITLRRRVSPANAWLALAAIAPITILFTYHRPYDAKLLMLTIPACAMLWAEGGLMARMASLVNIAGIVITSDIPLGIYFILTGNLHLPATGPCGKILAVMLTRPVPPILLAMSLFYLLAYLRRDAARGEA